MEQYVLDPNLVSSLKLEIIAQANIHFQKEFDEAVKLSKELSKEGMSPGEISSYIDLTVTKELSEELGKNKKED